MYINDEKEKWLSEVVAKNNKINKSVIEQANRLREQAKKIRI